MVVGTKFVAIDFRMAILHNFYTCGISKFYFLRVFLLVSIFRINSNVLKAFYWLQNTFDFLCLKSIFNLVTSLRIFLAFLPLVFW